MAQSSKESKQAAVYPLATIANTEVRRLHSFIVGDDYEISIALPKDYQNSTARYGVIYVPDEWLYFRTIYDTYRVLGLGGELPPLIIVGIGFPNTSTNYDTIRSKVRDLRTRDMSPYQVDSLDTPSMRARGVKTGGADKFLAFVKQELMPFIEKNYRASSEDKTYIGYSYGAIFGFYTLVHSPETFSRYLIGSPAFKWGKDKNLFIRYEKEYAATHKELPAKVFFSIGSLDEEFEGFIPAEKALRSRNYKGLTLKTWIFEGETHLSAPAGTISRGLHELYIAK
ncbi:IroE protein [Adhaeribacter aerolatus]|uniref:IroE protein n=1 Tax=Adhaeribacter aerolatus TaxID=670289 RepID=A0A512B4P1_9BACT|nr:IroE protein [Adhaeribacter aerolatus]